MTTQLDQSGNAYQTVNVYLGPSLGWTTVRVRPETNVTTTGTTTLQPDASVILVNVAAVVTLNLPDVATWVKEVASKPTTAFERSIFIKDLGNHATLFNITVHAFGGQLIDLSASDYTIATNGQMLRLYAMNDMSGWYVESNVNTAIGPGTVTTASIVDAAVTNAKLANMAQSTFKMRAAAAGTGVPIDGTAAQAKTALAIQGSDITGVALTKVDDTNVTLTLGGAPTTALVAAASITVGWTGTLSKARGGTAAATGAILNKAVQSFTSTGTYTPNANMLFALIECWGPGGGSGGVVGQNTAARSSGGGGAGGYSRKWVTAADIGASKAVTIGTGGAAGASGNNAGSPGSSATSVGVLCIANPGSGGGAQNNSTAIGGAGGTAGTGDFVQPGGDGQTGINMNITTVGIVAAMGGVPALGGATNGSAVGAGGATNLAGTAATSKGGGAAGAVALGVTANSAGAAGADGYVQVTEFLST